MGCSFSIPAQLTVFDRCANLYNNNELKCKRWIPTSSSALASRFSSYAKDVSAEKNDIFIEVGEVIDDVVCLPYIEGRITFCEVPEGCDAISFWFSGCAMAKFKYEGKWYVCHISLHGAGNTYDCREYWNTFVRNRRDSGIENIILFYPFTIASRSGLAMGIMDGSECRAFTADISPLNSEPIKPIETKEFPDSEVKKGAEAIIV
ncbi:MAG: hypothetical protein LBU92_00885 [Prevotellaceae bacterium]|jgi:hypothetical protein|nr:hypothetical protein [Prevotellaceae bacterium]